MQNVRAILGSNGKEVPRRIAMIVWNNLRHDARVRKEAETLCAAGHEVTVFALHQPGVTEERETILNGVRVVRTARHPFWSRSKRPVGARPRIRRAAGPRQGVVHVAIRALLLGWTHGLILMRVLVFRPDVVHAHDVNTLPTGWIAALLARAPLVYDAHEISTDREGYRKVRSLVGWVEKRLMPRAAATITTTDARAKFFACAYRTERPLVLQNRPRLEAAGGGDAIRQIIGATDDRPIVLYQGGLQQGRGLETLLDAAVMVETCRIVFLGSGRLERSLKDRAERLGLTGRVHFIPAVAVDVLPRFTASADIGVQPIENTCLNHFTTDSNKLFEYAMAGLPVVASDLREIRRIVTRHDLGILVPDARPDALAAALRRLADDPAERERFGRNARAAAPALSWEAQEASFVALYERIARKG